MQSDLSNPEGQEIPAELRDALVRMRLAATGERVTGAPLTGGVSSDIWLAELSIGPVCIKRALPRLKVEAEWRVPVERNSFEVAWMRLAQTIAPGSVPPILGEDREARAFAMAWLDPEHHPSWKQQLFAGRVSIDFAARVGNTLGRIHSATADSDDVAASFSTDANFYAIRLEPYLIASANKHPDVAARLERLAEVTAGTRRVLVHGDVSPKNILAAEEGPVFLDAECAWFGDPAFDVAFCLNHLLLKQVAVPDARSKLADAFGKLVAAYRSHVTWEQPAELELRTAALLPGLTLARVDGKSPVEYLTDDADRRAVRNAAKTLLKHPADRLDELIARWNEALSS